MQRRTKIVATLGPATDNPKVLDAVIAAGVDVVRLNMSHGTRAEHVRRADWIRHRADTIGRQVGVLADLQGPKIRIGMFRGGFAELIDGETFSLDTGCALDDGDQRRVGVTYPTLHQEVAHGDTLLLDDGHIALQVEKVEGTQVQCKVCVGGKLFNNKGLNKQGGGLSAPALTDKDRDDVAFAAGIGVDYLAVSFVRSARDVREVRALLQAAGGQAGIVAKIERAEALACIEDIIDASDAIMIARGDLGVEISDAELPAVQKRLIKLARAMNCVVMTATQMMQSMIDNPLPTRAEVFDVANAVLDGTDAVMLSAETAAGSFPALAVAAMERICKEAEKQAETRTSDHRLHSVFGRVDEAIAMASMYTANHLGVSAIAALTESGATPQWMSRISSAIPIYAVTSHVATLRKMTLLRGVYPVSFDLTDMDTVTANVEIIEELLRRGAVRNDDLVVLTKGDLNGQPGGTNVMKILRVGEHFIPE